MGHKRVPCDCGEMKDERSARCKACRRTAFVAECHPDRPHFAKGKCERCYANDYQRGSRSRTYQLRHMFGMTQERYEALLAAQGGLCAICGESEPGGIGTWHVDHNHACCAGKRSCGKCIRGLLCLQCNHMLGNSGDNPAVLEAAIRYLKDQTPRENERRDSTV